LLKDVLWSNGLEKNWNDRLSTYPFNHLTIQPFNQYYNIPFISRAAPQEFLFHPIGIPVGRENDKWV
jgi:hypothetical protein